MAILEKNRQLKQQLESSVKKTQEELSQTQEQEAVYKGQKEQLLQETTGTYGEKTAAKRAVGGGSKRRGQTAAASYHTGDQ
ncbi:MAG: hypothetical protein BHW44_02075 [Roseburia sp. 40_7]|nr:MAG: hypothetical protein BHW44_02075 [Roseburia sp. 40_7]